MDSQLVRVELVTAIAIEAITLAAALAALRVRVDDLGDALVAAEKLGHLRPELDEDVPAPGRGRLGRAEEHGLARRLGQRLANDAMRNEAALRERPEQLVELSGFFVRGAVDEHVVAELEGSVDDLAGELEPCVVRVA